MLRQWSGDSVKLSSATLPGTKRVRDLNSSEHIKFKNFLCLQGQDQVLNPYIDEAFTER